MKKIFLAIVMLALSFAARNVFAQTSAIRITSVVDSMALPNETKPVTVMYKITNPGKVPLSDVTVTDNACGAMSNHLGDTNGNSLLDTSEVWIYICTTAFTRTTTDTAMVTAYADGLKTTDSDTITVDVASSDATATYSPTLPNGGPNPGIPGLPDNGTNPNVPNATVIAWGILGGIFVLLIIVFVLTRKNNGH